MLVLDGYKTDNFERLRYWYYVFNVLESNIGIRLPNIITSRYNCPFLFFSFRVHS